MARKSTAEQWRDILSENNLDPTQFDAVLQAMVNQRLSAGEEVDALRDELTTSTNWLSFTAPPEAEALVERLESLEGPANKRGKKPKAIRTTKEGGYEMQPTLRQVLMEERANELIYTLDVAEEQQPPAPEPDPEPAQVAAPDDVAEVGSLPDDATGFLTDAADMDEMDVFEDGDIEEPEHITSFAEIVDGQIGYLLRPANEENETTILAELTRLESPEQAVPWLMALEATGVPVDHLLDGTFAFEENEDGFPHPYTHTLIDEAQYEVPYFMAPIELIHPDDVPFIEEMQHRLNEVLGEDNQLLFKYTVQNDAGENIECWFVQPVLWEALYTEVVQHQETFRQWQEETTRLAAEQAELAAMDAQGTEAALVEVDAAPEDEEMHTEDENAVPAESDETTIDDIPDEDPRFADEEPVIEDDVGPVVTEMTADVDELDLVEPQGETDDAPEEDVLPEVDAMEGMDALDAVELSTDPQARAALGGQEPLASAEDHTVDDAPDEEMPESEVVREDEPEPLVDGIDVQAGDAVITETDVLAQEPELVEVQDTLGDDKPIFYEPYEPPEPDMFDKLKVQVNSIIGTEFEDPHVVEILYRLYTGTTTGYSQDTLEIISQSKAHFPDSETALPRAPHTLKKAVESLKRAIGVDEYECLEMIKEACQTKYADIYGHELAARFPENLPATANLGELQGAEEDRQVVTTTARVS